MAAEPECEADITSTTDEDVTAAPDPRVKVLNIFHSVYKFEKRSLFYVGFSGSWAN
jgi:hypothetical protein